MDFVIHQGPGKNCLWILRDDYECILKVEGFIFFYILSSVQFSHSVMSNSLPPPWTAAHQASLTITNSRSLHKLMSIELVMPSNHLILCHLLFLLPSIFPSIRVLSRESVLHIRWPEYCSFSFSYQSFQ